MIGIETIKTIAMLCSIIAGDNPSIIFTADIIQNRQVKCHAYYASCLTDNNLIKCMINRPKVIEAEEKAHLEETRKANK